jgi:hypothetical protein
LGLNSPSHKGFILIQQTLNMFEKILTPNPCAEKPSFIRPRNLLT